MSSAYVNPGISRLVLGPRFHRVKSVLVPQLNMTPIFLCKPTVTVMTKACNRYPNQTNQSISWRQPWTLTNHQEPILTNKSSWTNYDDGVTNQPITNHHQPILITYCNQSPWTIINHGRTTMSAMTHKNGSWNHPHGYIHHLGSLWPWGTNHGE